MVTYKLWCIEGSNTPLPKRRRIVWTSCYVETLAVKPQTSASMQTARTISQTLNDLFCTSCRGETVRQLRIAPQRSEKLRLRFSSSPPGATWLVGHSVDRIACGSLCRSRTTRRTWSTGCVTTTNCTRTSSQTLNDLFSTSCREIP